jgi:hypothetical protein
MLLRIPKSAAFWCVAMLVAAVPAVPADDKADKDKPTASGSWLKKEGQLKIEFPDKGVIKIAPHGGDEFVVVCSYTITKEGLVKAKITDLEGKDEIKEKAKARLPVGLEWSFTWKVKDDTATLDDVQGKEVELLKSHLEGEFAKKRSD